MNQQTIKIDASPGYSMFTRSATCTWVLMILIICLVVLIPSMPSITMPGHDAGIFLYFGSQILDGKIPFRDIWDHKPPLVFYINALGLWLGSGSIWGVWVVEFISLSAAGIMAYIFLRRYFRHWIAGLAVLGALVNLVLILERGNLTEEYVLPFQFAALLLFASGERAGTYGWRGFGIGAALAFAFLLKQTLVGIWLVIFALLLYQALLDKRWQVFWKKTLTIVAGALLVFSACAIYFALQRSLGLLWDVAFTYNFIYSDVAFAQRVRQWLDELWIASAASGFFGIAFSSWFAALIYLLIHHPPTLKMVSSRWMGILFWAVAVPFLYRGLFQRGVTTANELPQHPLLDLTLRSVYDLHQIKLILVGVALVLVGFGYIILRISERKFYPWFENTFVMTSNSAGGNILLVIFLAVINLPMELALISTSSENYLHYFITLIPCYTILVAFFLDSLVSMVDRQTKNYMPLVWCLLFLIPIFEGGIYSLTNQIKPGRNLQVEQTVAFIEQNTAPQDNVLVWGSQVVVNFLSGRAAPTLYVHQKPLFKKGYTSPERVALFLDDIKTRSPALIVDTRLPSTPFVGFNEQGKCTWDELDYPLGIVEVYDFICKHYELVKVIGSDEWRVYRYRKIN